MNFVKSTVSMVILLMAFSMNAYANTNDWYLKDTERYENMRITNVFFAPYERSPRICVSLAAVDGNNEKDTTACAVADNGYYIKNGQGTGAFSELYDMVKYFYTTGETISVYLRKNEFSAFDSSVSKNELVGMGTCNDWCFGEDVS
ncbi:TPA: subtilase family AB5 toxin binding subunit [Providencia alcalifaciens]